MATDFTKQPLAILVDLINATNDIGLTTSDITFGPVSVLTAGDKNSGVTITATNGSGYIGSVDLTYDRVDLAAVPGTRNKVFQKGDAVNISDIIPSINAAYNLNLQPEDYVDGPLPETSETDPHEQVPFVLTAGADSYIYRGSVTLQLHSNDVLLSSVVTITDLDGLHYPTL